MLTLKVIQGRFAVSRMPPEAWPAWLPREGFLCVARTEDEVSVVCREDAVPLGVKSQKGWRAIGLVGPFAFTLTGVLASVLNPLAEARVPIFAISTFDTDYILIPEDHFDRALAVLQAAGHQRTA